MSRLNAADHDIETCNKLNANLQEIERIAQQLKAQKEKEKQFQKLLREISKLAFQSGKAAGTSHVTQLPASLLRLALKLAWCLRRHIQLCLC